MNRFAGPVRPALESHISVVMKRSIPDLTGDETIFEVPLDDVAVARLMTLSETTKVEPRLLLASLLRDILEDDAIENGDGLDGPDPLAHKHLH